MPEILTEGYLEIRAAETEEVVTIIEVLSLKNKQVGIGRSQIKFAIALEKNESS
ncbi:MAG: DUF4058 family protein [Stigonema ocellatum SAG 48.90 = DSM 106950]|nr:DUF4058 family protein [Stigonema ocellatum SAG 48.90 = DSM 106950]